MLKQKICNKLITSTKQSAVYCCVLLTLALTLLTFVLNTNTPRGCEAVNTQHTNTWKRVVVVDHMTRLILKGEKKKKKWFCYHIFLWKGDDHHEPQWGTSTPCTDFLRVGRIAGLITAAPCEEAGCYCYITCTTCPCAALYHQHETKHKNSLLF